MAENLGSVYIEIAAKADKILSDFKDIEARASQSASKIEGSFSRVRLNIDNALASKSLQDVQKMYTALQAKLQQKITLNADISSIDRTRTALQTVEEKLGGLQTVAASGSNAVGGMFAAR